MRTRARSRRQPDVTVPAEGDIFPSGFRVDAILAYGLGPGAPSLDPMFRQTPDEPEPEHQTDMVRVDGVWMPL
jgi:hypothetical protein